MSVANWKIIYRDYSEEEIEKELATQKEEAKNMYLAQSVGGKSYQRSITSVEERLRALAEVRRERSGNDYLEPTYVDFSGNY
tara:strand:+ start:799 stop:1044 length:246 start_codon:yes stop_codon:yes gene_type:complete